MEHAIRLLSHALDALLDAAQEITRHEYDLGLTVEGHACELDEILALIGSVDW